MRIGVDAAFVAAGTRDGRPAPWDRDVLGWRCATHIWLTRADKKRDRRPVSAAAAGIRQSGAPRRAGIVSRAADLDRLDDHSHRLSRFWLEEKERTMEPKTVGAAKFKKQCLSLIDSLAPEGLVITKGGRPVARVLPYRQDCASLIGSLRDRIKVRGEIMATGIRWHADKQP